MTRFRHVALVTAGLFAASCGGGGEGGGAPPLALASIESTGPYTGIPGFVARANTPFVVRGTRFGQAVGLDCIVRFVAETGTPFAGGTSDTVETPGAITPEGEVTGVSPIATLAHVTFVDAYVVVELPSGFEIASETPIARFLAPVLDGLTPEEFDAVVDPAPITVAGRFFGPSGEDQPVTLSWRAEGAILRGLVPNASVVVPPLVDRVTSAATLRPDGTIVGVTPDVVLTDGLEGELVLVEASFADGTTSAPNVGLPCLAEPPTLSVRPGLGDDRGPPPILAGVSSAVIVSGGHLGPTGTNLTLRWTCDDARVLFATPDASASAVVDEIDFASDPGRPSIGPGIRGTNARAFLPDFGPTANAVDLLGAVTLVGEAEWPDGTRAAQRIVRRAESRVERWMANVPDSTPLHQLSVPGTHDTMAYRADAIGTARTFAITQDNDLATQLALGARTIDIRCRHIDDVFAMHHGSVYLEAFFGSVLATLEAFLASHPSETILMNVQEEHTSSNVNRTFEATFRAYVGEHPGLFAALDTEVLPTMDGARGHVVLLRNFGIAGGASLGFPLRGTPTQRSDTTNSFELTCFKRNVAGGAIDTSCVSSKIVEVRGRLDVAGDDDLSSGSGTLRLTSLNATGYMSVLDLVAEVADLRWDPRDVSEIVNPAIYADFTGPRASQRKTGLVWLDFFRRDLAVEILRCNFKR